MARAAHRGFTLVEMMVVVAIVAILAAIATPAFLRYNYRARSAELPANLNAIRVCEQSFFAANGAYVTLNPAPTVCTAGSLAGPTPCSFAVFDSDGSDTDNGGFSGLGWIPAGRLYGQYSVVAGCEVTGRDYCYTAEAKADIDGDGQPQVWEFAHPSPTGLFATGTVFGGIVPPPDEGGSAQIDEVAKDFSLGLY